MLQVITPGKYDSAIRTTFLMRPGQLGKTVNILRCENRVPQRKIM